jgi:hypothetical protein
MESDAAVAIGQRESFASGTVKRLLWGESATIVLLLTASAVVLLGRLGAAELWTQEGRWAAICSHMIDSSDCGHPYLFGEPYYDKPLLSYWLMIGAAWILGGLNETALRLPSVLAGLLSLWCVYHLGRKRIDRTTGLIAAALLGSSWMFVFWGRVASADMLNVAGTLARTSVRSSISLPRILERSSSPSDGSWRRCGHRSRRRPRCSWSHRESRASSVPGTARSGISSPLSLEGGGGRFEGVIRSR